MGRKFIIHITPEWTDETVNLRKVWVKLCDNGITDFYEGAVYWYEVRYEDDTWISRSIFRADYEDEAEKVKKKILDAFEAGESEVFLY